MKKKAILGLAATSLMVLSGCDQSIVPEITKEPEKAGYSTFYPEKIEGSLHNPGMGWITLEEQTEIGKMDLGRNGTIPEADNVGIQTSWDLIEKQPDVFDWSLIDETIDYWTSHGKYINLRICTDSLSLPEVYYGAPRWLYDEPYNVGREAYEYNGSKTRGIVTDTANPQYRIRFENFLNKLSERYMNNPYVTTIDIRGYGMYGEWHSGHSFETMDDRIAGLAYIVEKYQEAFARKNKTLFLSCSWDYQGSNKDGSTASTKGLCDYDDYLRVSSLDQAMLLDNVAYRRDGLAGNGVTKYGTDEKALYDVIRSGKHVVNCGEYFAGYDLYKNETYGMNPIEATDELLFKSRCNYSTVLGWVNSEVIRIIESGDGEVFDRGNAKMGYRFAIDEAKYPTGVKQNVENEIFVQLSNSGLGRLNLEGYKLAFFLVSSKGEIRQKIINKEFDLRQLLNGEIANVYTKFTPNATLDDGTYTLAATIVNESGEPAIRLGQAGNYDQRLYPIGQINVGDYTVPEDKLYDVIEKGKLSSYTLANNSQYELTFDYTPSVSLSRDYTMGDDNGFELRLVNGDNVIVKHNWQDVSETKSSKTISFSTPESSNYHIEIEGTGVYKDKIVAENFKIKKVGGFLTSFDETYDIERDQWYTTSWDTDLYEDTNNVVDGTHHVVIGSELLHGDEIGLSSNLNSLKLKPNTAYKISFDTKGDTIGGNGAYYFVKLANGDETIETIGEWYDRPDAPTNNKTFTFIAPSNVDNVQICFGVHNQGAYIIDNINIVECSSGTIIKGQDVGFEHNVIPVDSEKGFGYVEGFENRVLNDCTFTYGFSRWGHLTTKTNEVISGNFSMTSLIDPVTFEFQDGNDFYEFMYSNNKYLKLEANQTYHINFKYKVMDEIRLLSNPSNLGKAYFFARSASNPAISSETIYFAESVVSEQLCEFNYDITVPNADDVYFVIGLLGVGNMIIDDIVVTKV